MCIRATDAADWNIGPLRAIWAVTWLGGLVSSADKIWMDKLAGENGSAGPHGGGDNLKEI